MSIGWLRIFVRSFLGFLPLLACICSIYHHVSVYPMIMVGNVYGRSHIHICVELLWLNPSVCGSHVPVTM